MAYTIEYYEKGSSSDKPKTMTIENDPKTLTITCGFIGPDGTAWRIADVDRTGKGPIFTIFSQSRITTKHPDKNPHE